MPTFRYTDEDGATYDVPYASEAELLEFANLIREAGGANVISEFFSAVPKDSESCLIANSLNFGCSVDGTMESEHPGEAIWTMDLPDDGEIVCKLAAATGCEVEEYEDINGAVRAQAIILPRLIGNAAAAFDCATEEDAWVAKYRWDDGE